MAKQKLQDRDDPKVGRAAGAKGSAAGRGAADAHGGGHGPAKAHGQPATIDASLPDNRAELIERHAEARRKRAAAPLGGRAYRAAADEIGRIEIKIAAVERAMTPPKG
jgi:hypothetical protein